MHKLRIASKRPDPTICEMDGCGWSPVWEIRTQLNTPRMSCSHHIAQLIEPGQNNLLIPIDVVERAAPRPWMFSAGQGLALAAAV